MGYITRVEDWVDYMLQILNPPMNIPFYYMSINSRFKIFQKFLSDTGPTLQSLNPDFYQKVCSIVHKYEYASELEVMTQPSYDSMLTELILTTSALLDSMLNT